MPSYTLAELREQLKFNVGRRDDLTDATLDFKINEALAEVITRVPPAELEKTDDTLLTVASERSVSLPADFDELVSISLLIDDIPYPLRRASVLELDEAGFTPTGTPQKYLLFGGALELWPTPDDAYEVVLRYRAKHADLQADADVPELPIPWRRAVLLKAEEMMFEALGDSVSAATARDRYLAYVESQPNEQAKRQRAQDRPAIQLYY